MVVIIMGLPGSGKSYFAQRLATALHAEYINSDQERKIMMPKRTYSEREKLSVYDKMLFRALELVKQKKDIVIDATFYTNAIRKKFIDAMQPKTNIQFIEIRADEWIIKERLQHPRPDSEADFSVYHIIKASWEVFPNDHLVLHSTNDNIEDMLQKALVYLPIKNDKRTN
jgi:predicted kinase